MSNIKMDNSRMQNHAIHEGKASRKSDKNQTVKHRDQECFEKTLGNGKKPHEAYADYDVCDDYEACEEYKAYEGYKEDEALISKDKKHSDTEKFSEEGVPPSQMDVLLSGRENMLKQFNATQYSNDVEQINSKITQDISVEKITKLAENILVSKADSKQQEVRITVNNDILAQTEIVINRDTDGGLLVSLVTDNDSSWQTLVQGQHDLRTLLVKTENNVTVRVQSMAENQSESNDAQKRSRSFIQANLNDDNS